MLLLWSYILLSFFMSVVLAAVSEQDLRTIPARAARLWAALLVVAALMAALVMIAQHPAMVV